MSSVPSYLSPAVSERVSGFAPIAAPDARVLILGSLPSRLSLQKQEYYGNPQNAFWRLMGELVGAGPELPYADRADILRQCGIAVWDVLYSAARSGSLDATIESAGARANDFPTFYKEHPDLVLVCFNGRKAAELYERLVVRQGISTIEAIEMKTMPSTSPAHASMTYAGKLRHWSAIRRAGNNNRRS